jgi:hypothetical protein
MKILSRADQLKNEFLNFLASLGFRFSENPNNVLMLNPIPYTESIIKDGALNCLASSSCAPMNDYNVEMIESSSIKVLKFSIEMLRRSRAALLYNVKSRIPQILLQKVIFSQGFEVVRIYCGTLLKEVRILLNNPFKVMKLVPEHINGLQNFMENTFRSLGNVMGFSLISNDSTLMSFVFDEPVKLTDLTKHYIEVESYARTAYITRDAIVKALRKVVIEKTLASFNDMSVYPELSMPVIEFLDIHTISIPINFEDECVTYLAINVSERPVSTVVKAYKGVITTVKVNGAMHSYRHRVVRVALAPYSEANITLCLTRL